MNEQLDVIGLGELLWDCFPDRRLPGGAPANVAFHAQQLGLSAAVATRVGQDPLGDELCQFLITQGLRTELVQRDPEHATGTVSVSAGLDNGGVSYQFLENSAWDFLHSDDDLLQAVRSAKSICFGTLAQRHATSRATIQRCLRLAPIETLVVYDVNLRPPFFNKDWIVKSLERANVLKLNSDEVTVLSQLFEFSFTDKRRFAKALLDRYRQLQMVCVTRGAHGCMVVTCDEEIELPGIKIDVADTVGAGDAFTAAVIFGQLKQWNLSMTLELANQFGALVASRPGAMPPLRSELEKLTDELGWSFRETPRP